MSVCRILLPVVMALLVAPRSVCAQKKRSPFVGPSPVGVEVTPCFWSWTKWADYPVNTLARAYTDAGVQSVLLTYELSHPSDGCAVAGNFTDIAADIAAFKQLGGRLVLSFGGSVAGAGHVQRTCTDTEKLASLLGGQLDAFGAQGLDMAIEGDNLQDTASNGRLVDALARVEAKRPETYVSFSFVATEAGLPGAAISILKDCAAKKVRVSRVNLMPSDEGLVGVGEGRAADRVIASVEAALLQLAAVWPKVDPRVMRHMVGVIPLIEAGDQAKPATWHFSLADAAQLAAYAKTQGLGLLGYWAIQRDSLAAQQGVLLPFHSAFQAAK